MVRQSEADLQRAITDYAVLRNWRWVHSRPGMDRRGRWSTPLAGHPGWPDLFLVRSGVALALELKAEAGKTTADQDAWIAMLGQVPGIQALVVRPSDFDHVMELLK